MRESHDETSYVPARNKQKIAKEGRARGQKKN